MYLNLETPIKNNKIEILTQDRTTEKKKILWKHQIEGSTKIKSQNKNLLKRLKIQKFKQKSQKPKIIK